MRWLLQCTVVLIICATAWGQSVSQLYTTSELQEIGNRYRPNLQGMWDADFLTQLTVDERKRAGAVTLNLPLVGANQLPLEFYSSPTQRKVFLPIASIKFIDDLSVAHAYYLKMGCDEGVVSEYAAVLRFRPQDVKGSPLDALGVPREALNDPYVDDIAQKLLKSIVFFAAAHEYGHVMYRHRGYNVITAQEAQQQEIEADAFALEIMRRIAVAPLGLPIFFITVSRMEVAPGDFTSPVEYENYLQKRATHPVSALRILKVTESIESHIDEFVRLQANPEHAKRQLQGLTQPLRVTAHDLDDRKMRRFLASRAQTADLAAFRRACVR